MLVALCGVACWLPAASLAQLSWLTPAAIDANGQQGLDGIACPSATQCTAVDNTGQQVTFDPASPGTPTPTTIDPNAILNAIACVSAEECTAVDATGHETTSRATSTTSLACAPSSVCTLNATATTGISSCQITFTPSTAASYTLTANYTGDNTHLASNSLSTPITATPIPVTPPPGRATFKKISASGPTISVRVSCTGTTSCTIKLTASVLETIRRGKAIAVAASTKKATKKTITIASKTATIPAGSTKTIKLTLNRAGKRLLAKHDPLKAKLTVTQSRRIVTSKTITLKPKTKQHHHKKRKG